MGDYPPEELVSERLVVFVVATTGSGAEPRAMIFLWSLLLRSDLPEDLCLWTRRHRLLGVLLASEEAISQDSQPGSTRNMSQR
ncbi:hypothetical protein PAXINDRAFT_12066 [Paxillus involutus ATCC 200175]|uniref:Uncharacterized protein n=1 Tax=Paxillus involutus ATCC 200175 TaxID=664439 RepID=A0A0C9U6Z0_PAXIN|nr:hypothetical protein PAXINDRAFT_12066 [Paxillus involutus ATCC 200175]